MYYCLSASRDTASLLSAIYKIIYLYGLSADYKKFIANLWLIDVYNN